MSLCVDLLRVNKVHVIRGEQNHLSCAGLVQMSGGLVTDADCIEVGVDEFEAALGLGCIGNPDVIDP